jgi:hypothetical protein
MTYLLCWQVLLPLKSSCSWRSVRNEWIHSPYSISNFGTIQCVPLITFGHRFFISNFVRPNMKLDATDLRYITSDEFRVLTAVGLFPVSIPACLIYQSVF